MSSLRTRIDRLEADLKAEPMRHYVYSDLPFAVFCYPPKAEWEMRWQMNLLKTRLEDEGPHPRPLYAGGHRREQGSAIHGNRGERGTGKLSHESLCRLSGIPGGS